MKQVSGKEFVRLIQKRGWLFRSLGNRAVGNLGFYGQVGFRGSALRHHEGDRDFTREH